MTDSAFATIGIAEQDDVAFFDLSVVSTKEPINKRSELPYDHLAATVGNQRKRVALFTNARAKRRSEERRIHFHAGIAQCILDDVERDRINRCFCKLFLVGFN